VPPVVLDTVPTGWSFGSVFRQPGEDVYTPGQTVEVVFWSANPRNNLRHGGTYLEVQRLHPVFNNWQTVHTDDDWCTKFIWDRPLDNSLDSQSMAKILWDIPEDAAVGTYRIKHHGDAKSLRGKLTAFTGVSKEFRVVSSRVRAVDRVTTARYAGDCGRAVRHLVRRDDHKVHTWGLGWGWGQTSSMAAMHSGCHVQLTNLEA